MMQMPEVFIFLSFARQLFPHSGLHEEVPEVPPDPGVCRQRGRQRNPQRRRRRDGDGAALRDRHRRPPASQAGTSPAVPLITPPRQMQPEI